MTEEDTVPVVLDHSGIVQVPWDHLDIALIGEHRVECNHSGRPQTAEAVNLEEDSSFPVAGHLVEGGMRSDDPLLPSS
jgi:hypothetical protein